MVGSNVKVSDYVAGKHYKDEGDGAGSKLEFFQHAEGRVVVDGSSFDYEFNLTDHLGNIRVTIDQSGTVVQKDDYYPFGLTFNHWNETSPENQYKYNGKEYQSETQWFDYEWRNYDASLGRFNSIDPHADRYLSMSPYNYAFNNPILFVDPDGRDGTLYLQVLTDEDGKVSEAAKQGIADAVNKLIADFVENGIEASIRISYGNDIISRDDFENSYEHEKGDSYTLIGTAAQLATATKVAYDKGWEYLGNSINSVDGTSGHDDNQNFSIVDLDKAINSDGSVRNSDDYRNGEFHFQNFDTVGEKLFAVIRHETAHDKLSRDPASNVLWGGHSDDIRNMLYPNLYKNQTYSYDQVQILRRLHNPLYPISSLIFPKSEPEFVRGFKLVK